MYDRAALQDLFGYTTFTWESYGRSVRALPADALTRPLPEPGWATTGAILFHLASAWDSWLRDSAHASGPLATADPVSTWDDIEAVRQTTRRWMRQLIEETSDEQLYERTMPTWDHTPAEIRAAMRVSTADTVAHLLLHERGHHGDVATALARVGGTEQNTDYLVYLFFKQRQESQ